MIWTKSSPRSESLTARFGSSLSNGSRFVFLVWVLLVASCSTTQTRTVENNLVQFDPSEAVTRSEAFVRAEETVRRCMVGQGFSYEVRPYVDDGRRAGIDQMRTDVFLNSADAWGYKGTFLALATLLVPSGAPRGLNSRSEVEGYDRAYIGAEEYQAHASDGTPHGHGDDAVHAHDEAGVGIGCKQQGVLALDDQTLRPEDVEDEVANEKFNEAFARLEATSEFVEFEALWAECMTASGYPPAGRSAQAKGFSGSAMAAHTAATQISFAQQAGRATSNLDIDVIATSSVDLAWLTDITTEHAEIDEVFQRELAAAGVDHRCRVQNGALIEAVLESAAIEAEVES